MSVHYLLDDDNGVKCEFNHDPMQLSLSIFLCVGLVVSYLPQHYRIIANKTSEGISAWFLLLGVISSTSSLLNIILLQWEIIVCCQELSTGRCLESVIGVFQIGFQWTGFTIVFILFLLYFPEHRKRAPHLPHSLHLDLPGPTTRSEEWRVSLGVAIACALHLILSVAISAYLLVSDGRQRTAYWAGFLGVSSMILAAFQYMPQIWKTWKRKAVGALSIPMMMLQTPGSALFVYTLATAKDTNWTTWITYAVTGMLQGLLLIMCIVWHYRAQRLGVDDIHAAPGTAAAEEEEREEDEQPTERSRLLAAERT
ncbi:hypothetical protein BC938DRAFT_475540 [Jimgerdemannia flammicorona]|uniref:PQ loop repeat-domain-containing protein n=1 Tax=Jimgerdemannia flammicorona TaxID=994334 RepID=A0A433QRJ2_9FUNG|nr:hypothetical protein BC938DRAFT_475540 [Jimgerdemannia flammicorona]